MMMAGGGERNREEVDYLSFNSPLRVAVRMELESALRNARLEGRSISMTPSGRGGIDTERPIPEMYEIKPNPLHIQQQPPPLRGGAAKGKGPQQYGTPDRTANSTSSSKLSSPTGHRRQLEPLPFHTSPVKSSAVSSPPKAPTQSRGPTVAIPSPLAIQNRSTDTANLLPPSPIGGHTGGGGTLRALINNSPPKAGQATSLYTSTPSKRLLDSIMGPRR